MEAATPLRRTRVNALIGRVIVEHLVVDDPVAAELVRNAEDPERVIADAIEIGARILDREQAGASVEVLRADLEKASREVEERLGATSEQVVTELRTRLQEAFGPDQGHVTKVLDRHFGAESSTAVQHQVRTAVAELLTESRERMFKQFSSADDSNPLASFQRLAVAAIRQSSDQQHTHLREMNERIASLQVEITKLQAEKEKALEVAAEHDRSAAKGRPYEEAVFDAIDAIAGGQGDDCDAVGDLQGVGGRKGDVLINIDGCSGASRGRIVIEAKHSRVAKKAALAELDEAMTQRDAAFGIWVVASEEQLPARVQPLREVNGDKLFVVYDPEEGRQGLQLAYLLARARVLMARGEAEGLDTAALRGEVERARGALEDTRRIRHQLTNAVNGVEAAREIVGAMEHRVKAHLDQIEALLVGSEEE